MSKKAFTYIELLITLAIIAVLFVPIMHLFSHSLYSSSTSQDLITATNLARWQLERLKNLNFSKEQLRQMGDGIYPPADEEPMEINNMKWRIMRHIVKEKDPVEVQISVYRDGENKPVVKLVTLVEDMFWGNVEPVPET